MDAVGAPRTRKHRGYKRVAAMRALTFATAKLFATWPSTMGCLVADPLLPLSSESELSHSRFFF